MNRSLRAFLLFASVALTVGGSWVRAGDPAPQKFLPIPIDVEGRETAPGFYVGIQEKAFDLSVETLAKDAAPESAEHALAEYLNAIAANDLPKYRAVTDAGKDAAAELAEDRSEISKRAKVRAVRRFAVGGATLFVLDMHGKADAPLLTLLFESKGGRHICSLKGLDHPIVQLLMTLARAIDTSPADFVATDAPVDCPHSITFNKLFGDDGQHPVTVRFNGYAVNYPIGIHKVLPPDARTLKGLPDDYASAVRLYGDAVASMASDEVDGYAACLGGPSSKQYFQEAITRARKSLVEDYARPRYIRYVLGSPRLKVLIHMPEDGQNPNFALSYEEVATPRAGGKASIVNFHQQGTLDNLLTWPEFQKAFVAKYIDPPPGHSDNR